MLGIRRLTEDDFLVFFNPGNIEYPFSLRAIESKKPYGLAAEP